MRHRVHVLCLTPPRFVLTPPAATAQPVAPHRALLDPRGLSDLMSPHSHLRACCLLLQIINTLKKVSNSEGFPPLALSTLPNSPEDKNPSFAHAFPRRPLCLALSALQLFCSPRVTSTALSEGFPSSCCEVLINPVSQLSYIH